MSPAVPPWGPPDAQGIRSCRLDDPLRASLKGQRRLRCGTPRPLELDVWPTDERQLLADWLRRADAHPLRHDALLRKAGPARASLADRLVQRLLGAGAVEVEETQERGYWKLRSVRFLDPAPLRRQLDLPEPDADRQAWRSASQRRFDHPELDQAAQGLDDLPPARALARLALLVALEAWQADGRSGTWRDFAQFARGDTKQLSDAERSWLEGALTLADFRISGHTPLLLVRLPATLALGARQLALDAAPDFAALTPATVAALTAATPPPRCWRLVENRTSFERLARTAAPDDAVLWLPGYPPSWWRLAVDQLLHHLPAPAWIACDPDPDGVAIALHAGALWTQRGLGWQAWKMSPADLERLPARRPLSERDECLLARLADGPALPAPLDALVGWMRTRREKGEQEALL